MHPTKLGRIWLAEIFRAEEMVVVSAEEMRTGNGT
jgi:hypothetical protein